MNFTPEQLAKAKASESAEELFEYANKNGYALTEEEARSYFNQWNKEGAIADEELDNVAGGSTCVNGSSYSDDEPYYLITTDGNWCDGWSPFRSGEMSHTCVNCSWSNRPDGLFVLYCEKRTKFHDPHNSAIGNGYYKW